MKAEDLLTPDLSFQIRAHALEAYPKEATGVIAAGKYVRLENNHEQPEKAATIRKGAIGKYVVNKTLQAVVHSHPDAPNCPSQQDMESQIRMGVPFVICATNGTASLAPFAWGEQLDPPPLIGRGFQHGVTDCWALVKDKFWLDKGVRLPDVPRNWNWWNDGQNLYTDYIAKAGFVEVDRRDVRPGDGVLFQIRSETPNHAGVVEEGGLLLHHVTAKLPYDPTRLSKHEPLDRWLDYATHFLRYEG